MATEFNLPGSSFEEVQKILKGYSHTADKVSLDELSKLTGMNKSIISRNNKFLTDIGLISGGQKKSTTDLGKKLGRAIEHKQNGDVQSYWREAIQTNEKVAGLVTTVRIKDGMTEGDLSTHILYVSGQNSTAGNKTGARCVVDVLIAAKLLQEEDGKLVVSPAPTKETPADMSPDASASVTPPLAGVQVVTQGASGQATELPVVANLTPQIVINIQLQLPETDNADVYVNLFKALRENLISPKE